MATEDHWADPVIDREKTPLGRFFPKLDEVIHEDDPVRLVDEVLTMIDWSEWEFHYPRRRGQPRIHRKHVASVIFYGLCRGIRSSRQLEKACNYRLDFMWPVRGRRFDHTTFSKFRTKFHEPLKGLFKQICQINMTLGLIRLGEVGFDVTRVKANNSRFRTRTAKTLEEKLQDRAELYDHLASQVDVCDAEEADQGSRTHLPESLADIEQRRQQVKAAPEQARAADEARRRQGVNPEKNPAQVPTTDPESRVMSNKEGGYAPNCTPTATTDGYRGFIVADDVFEVNESSADAASVDRIEETFIQRPEKFLTDAGNNSGQVMHAMEQRGVEFYAPAASHQSQPRNPALRDDPTRPVPESEWGKLKRNNPGQLHRSCFVYVPEDDLYYCPQGQPMPFEKTKSNGEVI